MSKYLKRLTHSARGEAFNPLVYPFLLTTFAYGLGFIIPIQAIIGTSSLYGTMSDIHPSLPFVWGGLAIATVIMGATFLLFDIPPAGSWSGLLGFMTWLFVAILFVLDSEWLVLIAVSLPNAFFWIWQFLSLSKFSREDKADTRTMRHYNAGGYDSLDNPIDGKAARENNRGADLQ